ncbi:hypothetical protein GCM10010412_093330 [Nonomuraea recticatena]|uniref:Uncharacterized protein n=2 Tax=Nonomuraea recticatena TaxID=46178 RepID=A0ABN3TCF1_9ACTN
MDDLEVPCKQKVRGSIPLVGSHVKGLFLDREEAFSILYSSGIQLRGLMIETRMLSFVAWRDGHYPGLGELLATLSPLVAGYEWRMIIDWSNPSVEVSADAWLNSAEVLRLFDARVQLIDGEAIGRGVSSSASDVRLRAFDSGSWDVWTTRPDVAWRVSQLYPDAAELEEW